MNNVTMEISTTIGFFRRHLLGESLRNSLIRLTVILTAIIIVWSGIVIALIIHMKCLRARQMLKGSKGHYFYGSNSNLTRKRSSRRKRNRRYHSSLSSLPLSPIRRIVSYFNQRLMFWSSSRTDNEIFTKRSFSRTIRKEQRESEETNPCIDSNRVQIVVENMTRRTLSFDRKQRKISFFPEPDSSSHDESKRLYSPNDESKSHIETNQKTSNVLQVIEPIGYVHHPSITFPINANTNNSQTTTRLQKLHEFNTKATLFFHPITRRLSNTNPISSLSPINTIQKQHRKSLLMVSSARELTSDNEWRWSHSLLNVQATATNESSTSNSRQLPLVMITDTSSSNTNIVELETYEDNHRLISDVGQRLARELRASYRPRHST